MDRHPLGLKRPPLLQRAVSSSHITADGLKRSHLPSRLSNVRSLSQPSRLLARLGEAATSEARNTAAFVANSVHVSASPAAIENEEDDIERPPAKRLKVREDGRAPEADVQARDADTPDAVYRTLPGPSLPEPPKFPTATRQSIVRKEPSQAERAARKGIGLEPPAMAVRLPAPRNVADFSPWNGKHPEDTLNEAVVKNGYSDKPPAGGPTSIESNSAKATIWPTLSQKNHMGLQTLSYLFTSVMEKRQMLGKVTPASTFKPPPRVTVTDTKREAWLRDLANTDIPLRKQSRTIPHGIRGKLLMEQCLSKSIPMPRAVWLAKCVGANELRAFRRKGVSGAAAAWGENKWVLEWTMHVEQFLETIIAACGQPDWQSKMNYAVKLTTSFYHERLLEREHFLNWIVSSFADADITTLPIWILLAQLYWRDITAFGRRGQTLADAVLDTLFEIQQGNICVTDMFKARLQNLVTVLAISHRGALILPRVWRRYRHLLSPEALSGDRPTLVATAIHDITKRNERLVGPLMRTPENTRCPALTLYILLDSVGLDVDTDSLMSACLSTVRDSQDLVSALLDWSASIYRTGVSRIYLAAALISRLQRNGHDTDGAILQYLKVANADLLIVDNLHRVICQLASTGTFSVGRYLQWLITVGAISDPDSYALAAGLLRALPTRNLPPHLANTRLMLLRRLAGFQADSPKIVYDLEGALTQLIDQSDSSVSDVFDQVAQSDISTRSELAQRLCTQAMLAAKEDSLTLRGLCVYRSALEACGDFMALGDLMEAVAASNATANLATAADTLNMYAAVFAALGRLQSLLDCLLEQYRQLRSQQALDRTWILSLSDLAKRFSEKATFVLLFENDLVICEQQSSMAVCSPASDNLVSMQGSPLDTDNDIDAVFASGNTMDEHLMQRVFMRIARRAEKPGPHVLHAPSKLCEWFNQLRSVDTIGFQQLIKTYLESCLHGATENVTPPKAISALIASGCITFDAVVDLAKTIQSAKVASFVLLLLTSDSVINDSLHLAERYRYRVQRERFCGDAAQQILPFIANALEEELMPSLRHELRRLVLEYAATNGSDLSKLVHDSLRSPSFVLNYGRIVMQCLRLEAPPGDSMAQLDYPAVAAMADPLSIFHCSRALELGSTTPNGTDARKDVLQQAILNAVSRGSAVWPQLLAQAGQVTANSVFHWAQDRVLTALASERDSSVAIDSDIDRYLEVLDVAHHAAHDIDRGLVVGALTEKFRNIDSVLLADGPDEDKNLSHTSAVASLRVLLHLCILYSNGSDPDVDSQNQSAGPLLASLCSLLANPQLQTRRDTLDAVSDVASALADGLPDSTLAALPKPLVALAARFPRIAAIIGAPSAPDAWLALVSHPPLPPPALPRALVKQATNGPQLTGRSAPQSPGGGAGVGVPGGWAKAYGRPDGRAGAAAETTRISPFVLRPWEIMSDAAPTLGDNDTSVNLSLFGARKL